MCFIAVINRESQELVIPDDVEIYDNICCHSEVEENEYSKCLMGILRMQKVLFQEKYMKGGTPCIGI